MAGKGRPYKVDPELEKVAKEAQEARRNEDWDRLKELKRKLKRESTICGAVMGASKDYRTCKRKPVSESKGRCALHGGKTTGPTTEEGKMKSKRQLNPQANMIHGIYSKDFKSTLTEAEVEFYNWSIDWFMEEHPEYVDPVNLTLFERYVMNRIKVARKDGTDFLGDSQSYNDSEVKMLRFSEVLGLNRKFKESKDNKDNTNNLGITALFMDDKDDTH
ncbi:hypothetical protein K8O68_07730 [Salipaludibacillus sp. CUR1]|uniref:HGGxSTG domain-containing protein n=1 Tax=Salipaludibacillus sp. CUR1 TaxID=2820003 RepID=UPI001E548A08|nr:HGGxSTG domain-containing protein [Salipaludibacillus sp. CUR1]MCE7792309.1 hypothetical protein [Salipaludibacillus sp. CUR1]